MLRVETMEKELICLTVVQRRIVVGLLTVFAGAYILQLFSPLRINTDSYRLLSMAVSAAHGNGFLVDGRVDQYPVGYPAIVMSLIQLEMASSATLIALNLLSLILGMFLSWCLIQPLLGRDGATVVVVMALCSWVTIKHSTLPTTDAVYFAVATLSILCISKCASCSGKDKWVWLFSAAASSFAALHVRSVALSIVPVLVVVAGQCCGVTSIKQLWIRRSAGFAFTGVVVFITILWLLVRETEWHTNQFTRSGGYFQNLLSAVRSAGAMKLLGEIVSYRLLEMGEILVNVPAAKFGALKPVLYLSGAFGWILLTCAFWKIHYKAQVIVLYFLSYAVLMYLWPAYDSRFWIPVLPLIGVGVVTGLVFIRSHIGVLNNICALYLIIFSSAGMIAVSVSTRLSLAGSEFSELYGDASSRMTYRYYFQNGRPIDIERVNMEQVRLLRIFEGAHSR